MDERSSPPGKRRLGAFSSPGKRRLGAFFLPGKRSLGAFSLPGQRSLAPSLCRAKEAWAPSLCRARKAWRLLFAGQEKPGRPLSNGPERPGRPLSAEQERPGCRRGPPQGGVRPSDLPARARASSPNGQRRTCHCWGERIRKPEGRAQGPDREDKNKRQKQTACNTDCRSQPAA